MARAGKAQRREGEEDQRRGHASLINSHGNDLSFPRFAARNTRRVGGRVSEKKKKKEINEKTRARGIFRNTFS